MIIDCHVYSFPERLRKPGLPIPSSDAQAAEALFDHPESPLALALSAPESIRESMCTAGIELSVLVSMPWASPDLCRETNEHVLEMAQLPYFACIASVQPKKPGWRDEAERALAEGALGIKINPRWQGFALDDACVLELADLIADKKRVLMTHVDQAYRTSECGAAHLISLAAQRPHTRILAAHMGGLLGMYASLPQVASRLGNLWFDTAISATLYMVPVYMRLGLGSHVVFGSDYPFNHCHSQKVVLEDLRKEVTEPDNQKRVIGENFRAFLEKTQAE